MYFTYLNMFCQLKNIHMYVSLHTVLYMCLSNGGKKMLYKNDRMLYNNYCLKEKNEKIFTL